MTDKIKQIFNPLTGKFDQVNDVSEYDAHIASTSNPHSVTKSQVGLGNVPNVDATNPANIVQTSSYRFVTDTEKSTWNGKQDALGFTPENVSNKESLTLDTSSTKYPSNNLVKTYVDAGLSGKENTGVASSLVSAHVAAADPHPQYETSAEAQAKVNAHANRTDNPHSVTKTQVGLGNVDNTSDLNKPISTATQTALNGKANLSGGNSFTGTQVFGDGVLNRFSADIVTVTSFPYTLQVSDNGKILRFSTGTNSQVNLPNSLPVGFNIAWSQAGTGIITFFPASGATMNNRQNHTRTGGQHGMGSLVVMTNTGTDAMYNLSGDTQT